MKSYETMPNLSDVYLEDSYVLSIKEGDGYVDFDLEVVITHTHPDYSGPKPGEQYDYRRSHLRLHDATDVRWEGRRLRPARDASGELDYGSIDTMTFCGSSYRLTGSFGTLTLNASKVTLTLSDA